VAAAGAAASDRRKEAKGRALADEYAATGIGDRANTVCAL